jgi:Flp pilus assembly pilin Flp
MLRPLLKLWKDQRGQDLIEYALMCGLIVTGSAVLLPQSILVSMSSIYSRLSSSLVSLGGG